MQIAFYASTPSYHAVMDLYGWTETAQKLSGFAAKGEWAEMPMLITDEMLNEFCLVTTQENLANNLKKRYDGIADRLRCTRPLCRGRRIGGGENWRRRLKNDYHLQQTLRG